MPNDNDNNDISDLSIEQINNLYSDIIEFPEDIRIAVEVDGNTPVFNYLCDYK